MYNLKINYKYTNILIFYKMKIAIIGKMCSGKSTLCDKIINYYIIKCINSKRAFEIKYTIAYTLFNMKKIENYFKILVQKCVKLIKMYG